MASDVTFPLLDPADAQRMLEYARSQESGLTLPTSESAHIDSQIERVINDDVFIGSIEDAAPAAHYLEAREILRETAGTIDNVDDSLTIASLGAITGQPQLVGHGYSRIALAWLHNGDREKAEQFAAKAADAGDTRVQQALAAAKEKEEQEARERAQAKKAAQAEKAAQAARAAQAEKAEKEARAAKEAQAAQAAQAAKSAQATTSAHASSQSSRSAVSLSQLRSQLDAAKQGNLAASKQGHPEAHADEFVAINDAVTAGDFNGSGAAMADVLSVILESAVGALWASDSDQHRSRVAQQSFGILINARREADYAQLPPRMLGLFYSYAAANMGDSAEKRVKCFEAAAKEFARSGNLDGELKSLIQTIELDVQHRDPAEAYDLLASRYVESTKINSLPISAKWTELYSESLLTQTGNLLKSKEVLLNFLEKHPIAEAAHPDEQSALAGVAELLGDRFSSADAHQRAREYYHLAYNLFASAGNTQALEKLSKKA